MSKTESKDLSRLGRNPLNKIGEKKIRTLPALETVQVSNIPLIEKVKELHIQIDWQEFYRATIESRIKSVSRFFLRF